MTEPTTIEKIDAMLKAADRAETYECTVLVKHGDPLHRKQYTDFVLASVNGIRPMLEAFRAAYIEIDEIESSSAEVGEPSNGTGYIVARAVVEPLWQAFKEARDD